MTGAAAPACGAPPVAVEAAERAAVARFAAALADDFDLIANLHDREPGREVVEAARQAPIGDQLGLRLVSDRAQEALAAFARMLDDLPPTIGDDVLQDLAAGYADVYLRHTYRAAPTESVWLTEDGLERQAPMFRVREWYRRHNLVVTDWASRPDDHIVLQLRFTAHLLRTGAIADAARFLDAHLATWAPRFAERLVHAGAPDWYAAIALLTACYIDEARAHLAAITGIAVPAAAVTTAPLEASADGAEAPYVPGVAPSG